MLRSCCLEDERATAALVGQLLAAERVTNPIEALDTGAAALGYLDRVVSGAASMPVLCVLDLSLPDISGLEVLRHIRTTPELAHLTVIMLTGSGNDADIETAYDLGIDAYLIKPAGVHGLPDVVRELNLAYELVPTKGRSVPESAYEEYQRQRGTIRWLIALACVVVAGRRRRRSAHADVEPPDQPGARAGLGRPELCAEHQQLHAGRA